MDGILDGLNSAQRTAVTSDAAVLQVLAPPGSGKTKTLTARVAYFIAHRQIKPWNIIVCTFTVKAAREMQERIRGFVGEQLEKKLNIGTFHGISIRYLRKYGKYVGLVDSFNVADTTDSTAIIKRIIADSKFSLDPKAARNRISTNKNKGVDSEAFSLTVKKQNADQQEFSQLFSEYQTRLQAHNLLDFDDLLLQCVALLKSHPECVANVEALLVDEFQDTNGVQYELMGLLAGRQNVITIVGDPDQSIYGWRAADIKNLGRMKQHWPDTLTVNLEENYRSSGAILYAAQKIIEQDESRPPKRLQATHTLGERPILRKLPKAKWEAKWISTEIKRVQALTGNMLELSDFAILLRTAPLSRDIETALGQAGMAYRMIGGTRFYDRVEIRLVIDYLRVINQPSHNEAVQRIINVPARKIGDKTVEALQKEAHHKGVSLWNLVLDIARGRARLSARITPQAQKGIEQFTNVILTGQKKADSDRTALGDLLNLVLNKLSFQDFLKQKYTDDHETRWANVEELIAQAIDSSRQETDQPLPDEVAMPDLDDIGASEETPLSNFLANAALTGAADQKSDEGGEKVHQITISTIHAAKGLEWPVVFIPACYDGSIPHSRAEDHDEERRLLYVGMTRAQALLYMSCPAKNSRMEETTMSTFLTQPGMSNFFEEHGPSLSASRVSNLATTLRRECPSSDVIARTKASLESTEDNYWPLTGEMPLEALARGEEGYGHGSGPVFGTTRPAAWATGSVTMGEQGNAPAGQGGFKSGFISGASKFNELMQEQDAKQLRRLEKLAADQEKDAKEQAPKGKKRQIEGQGNIAGFFAKKTRPEPIVAKSNPPIVSAAATLPQLGSAPLRDISNMSASHLGSSDLSRPAVSTTRKPRTGPLFRAHSSNVVQSEPSYQSQNGFVLLSSSPTKPDDDEREIASDPPATRRPVAEAPAISAYKPATTLHSTSMQNIPPQRKTLGMRRSLNGWNSRGGKR